MNLKKCPLCGGKAMLFHTDMDNYKKDHFKVWWYIECSKCHVKTDKYSTDYVFTDDGDIRISSFTDGRKSIIKYWNKRGIDNETDDNGASPATP